MVTQHMQTHSKIVTSIPYILQKKIILQQLKKSLTVNVSLLPLFVHNDYHDVLFNVLHSIQPSFYKVQYCRVPFFVWNCLFIGHEKEISTVLIEMVVIFSNAFKKKGAKG